MNYCHASALALCLISSSVLAQVNYADVMLTQLQPTLQDTVWSRTTEVSPRYPVEMARSGIAGCAVFKVDIDAEGKTQNVELVSSVPAKGLNKPTKKVIKSLKWHNTSGKANVAEQKLLRLDFCMGGKSVEEAKARCEVQAKLQCSE